MKTDKKVCSKFRKKISCRPKPRTGTREKATLQDGCFRIHYFYRYYEGRPGLCLDNVFVGGIYCSPTGKWCSFLQPYRVFCNFGQDDDTSLISCIAMSLIQCRSRPKSSSYMIMPNKVFHIEQHIHVAHATLFAFHLVVLL